MTTGTSNCSWVGRAYPHDRRKSAPRIFYCTEATARHASRVHWIAALQGIEWWNYDFRTILNKTHITDIDLFIDRLSHMISNGTIEPFRPRRHYIRELLLQSQSA